MRLDRGFFSIFLCCQGGGWEGRGGAASCLRRSGVLWNVRVGLELLHLPCVVALTFAARAKDQTMGTLWCATFNPHSEAPYKVDVRDRGICVSDKASVNIYWIVFYYIFSGPCLQDGRTGCHFPSLSGLCVVLYHF